MFIIIFVSAPMGNFSTSVACVYTNLARTIRLLVFAAVLHTCRFRQLAQKAQLRTYMWVVFLQE
jgi:hypothetical protein